jgi:probable rRNA maturation factor
MKKRRVVNAAVEVSQVNTAAPPEIEALVQSAVLATLRHLRVGHASLSVTLMDDAGITKMNRQYLRHNHVTDVISFPLWEIDEPPVGDIYIGYEQAQRQAEEAGVELEQEIARLAIHGTLHVLGHDHPEDETRTASAMWQLQETILRAFT